MSTIIDLPKYSINLDLPPKDRWKRLGNEVKDGILLLFEWMKTHYLPSLKMGNIFGPPKTQKERREFADIFIKGLAKQKNNTTTGNDNDNDNDDNSNDFSYYYYKEEIIEELYGLSEITNLPIEDIIIYQICLEQIFYGTSIVVSNDNCTNVTTQSSENSDPSSDNILSKENFNLNLSSAPIHLFLFDGGLKGLLHPLIARIDFKRNEEILYTGITILGCVGLFCGMKSSCFSISITSKISAESVWGNVRMNEVNLDNTLFLKKKNNNNNNSSSTPSSYSSYLLPCFFVRELCEQQTHDDLNNNNDLYHHVIRIASNTELLHSSYIIIANGGQGQSVDAVVLTRERMQLVNEVHLNTSSQYQLYNPWAWARADSQSIRQPFLIQTNIDHWNHNEMDNIAFSIERRKACKEFISKMNYQFTHDKIWELLSHPPLLNDLTVMGVYMSSASNICRGRFPTEINQQDDDDQDEQQQQQQYINILDDTTTTVKSSSRYTFMKSYRTTTVAGSNRMSECIYCGKYFLKGKNNNGGDCIHPEKWHANVTDCMGSMMKCTSKVSLFSKGGHWGCCYSTELNGFCNLSRPHVVISKCTYCQSDFLNTGNLKRNNIYSKLLSAGHTTTNNSQSIDTTQSRVLDDLSSVKTEFQDMDAADDDECIHEELEVPENLMMKDGKTLKSELEETSKILQRLEEKIKKRKESERYNYTTGVGETIEGIPFGKLNVSLLNATTSKNISKIFDDADNLVIAIKVCYDTQHKFESPTAQISKRGKIQLLNSGEKSIFFLQDFEFVPMKSRFGYVFFKLLTPINASSSSSSKKAIEYGTARIPLGKLISQKKLELVIPLDLHKDLFKNTSQQNKKDFDIDMDVLPSIKLHMRMEFTFSSLFSMEQKLKETLQSYEHLQNAVTIYEKRELTNENCSNKSITGDSYNDKDEEANIEKNVEDFYSKI